MAAAHLIVDIDRLERQGETFAGDLAPEVLQLDRNSLELFPSWGQLRYDLFVQRIDSELLVRGTVRMHFECLCSRCAGRFEWQALDEHLAVAVPLEDHTDCFVDLTADLREAIILLLPSHPLCHSSCRGLCARCGSDLNRGPCDCRPETDGRWSVLEELGN